ESKQITISGPVDIVDGNLPNGVAGSIYSATVTGAGGIAPYTFTSLNLPASLSISAGGVISGTPAAAGTTSVNITITDSSVPPQTKTESKQLTINPALDIVDG